MLKDWEKSKTIILGILVIALGITELIAGLPPGTSVATIVAGILAIILRFFTNTTIR